MAPTASADSSLPTIVTMFSEGEWVGQGQAREFDPTNSTVSGSAADTGISLTMNGGTSGTNFSFDIAPPAGSSFAIGYYTGAQRTAFRSAGRPGIDIGGDGRGCNTVTGAFEVRELTYTGTSITRLDLLYEQHCEGGTNALFGEIQIGRPQVAGLTTSSSSITWPQAGLGALGKTVPVYIRNPGPATVALGTASIDGAAASEFGLHLDGCSGQVLVPTASCAFYVGFAPTTQGPRTARAHIPMGGRDYGVQLDGPVAAGVTSLTMQSDPGDWVGKGQSYSFSRANATFGFRGSPSGLSASLSGSDGQWWYVDMYPGQGQVLDVGNYPNATRYPFNGTGNGLSVSGNGAGCNNLTGSFTVNQVAFSPVDNSLQHFSATFTQHCEGSAPALTGELKYNSAPVITPPPPVSKLTARPANGRLALGWDNPTSSVYRYTVVRVHPRTSMPIAPHTAVAVYSGSGTSAVLRGLDPGALYTVTAFTVDQYGNVSYPVQLNVVGPPRSPAVVDLDGDGASDATVFRSSAGAWYAHQSSAGDSTLSYGAAGDIPVAGDYDGDGKVDQAIFRPATGLWAIHASGGGDVFMTYGVSTDIAVPADYTGDGKADVAVYRPSTGTWFVRDTSSGADVATTFGGISGDVPVPADYDNDGKVDLAIFRSGDWFVRQSGGGPDTGTRWGAGGDVPMTGDYDGDGGADLAIYRPSTGLWAVHPASAADTAMTYGGISGDVPLAADYDGDGTSDIAIFRPSVGGWYIHRSSDGADAAATWGLPSDTPLPMPYAVRSASLP